MQQNMKALETHEIQTSYEFAWISTLLMAIICKEPSLTLKLLKKCHSKNIEYAVTFDIYVQT